MIEISSQNHEHASEGHVRRFEELSENVVNVADNFRVTETKLVDDEGSDVLQPYAVVLLEAELFLLQRLGVVFLELAV